MSSLQWMQTWQFTRSLSFLSIPETGYTFPHYIWKQLKQVVHDTSHHLSLGPYTLSHPASQLIIESLIGFGVDLAILRMGKWHTGMFRKWRLLFLWKFCKETLWTTVHILSAYSYWCRKLGFSVHWGWIESWRQSSEWSRKVALLLCQVKRDTVG